MDEGIRSGKSLCLGMPEAPQGNIQGLPSNQAWGCPRRHPLFLLTIIGNFTWSYIFIRHMICVNLGASFAFSFHFYLMHHVGMRQSMVYLQNAHCTSLKCFEYCFIECFMTCTYRMNETNSKTYRYLLNKEEMPSGASPSLGA